MQWQDRGRDLSRNDSINIFHPQITKEECGRTAQLVGMRSYAVRGIVPIHNAYARLPLSHPLSFESPTLVNLRVDERLEEGGGALEEGREWICRRLRCAVIPESLDRLDIRRVREGRRKSGDVEAGLMERDDYQRGNSSRRELNEQCELIRPPCC